MFWQIFLLALAGRSLQVQYQLKPYDGKYLTLEANNKTYSSHGECRRICTAWQDCCGFVFTFAEPNTLCKFFTNCEPFENDREYNLPFYVKTDLDNASVADSVHTSITTMGAVSFTELTSTTVTMEEATSTKVTTSSEEDTTTTLPESTSTEEPTTTETTELTTTMVPIIIPDYICNADGTEPNDLATVSVDNDQLYSHGACVNVTQEEQLPKSNSKFKEMPIPGQGWYKTLVSDYGNEKLSKNVTVDLDLFYEEESGTVQVLRASKLSDEVCSLLFTCKNGCKSLAITVNDENQTTYVDNGKIGIMLTWHYGGWGVDRDRRQYFENNTVTSFKKFECVP